MLPGTTFEQTIKVRKLWGIGVYGNLKHQSSVQLWAVSVLRTNSRWKNLMGVLRKLISPLIPWYDNMRGYPLDRHGFGDLVESLAFNEILEVKLP